MIKLLKKYTCDLSGTRDTYDMCMLLSTIFQMLFQFASLVDEFGKYLNFFLQKIRIISSKDKFQHFSKLQGFNNFLRFKVSKFRELSYLVLFLGLIA